MSVTRVELQLLPEEAELLVFGDWLFARARYLTLALAWMNPRLRDRYLNRVTQIVARELDSLRADVGTGVIHYPTRLRCFLLRRLVESSAHLQGKLFEERKAKLLEKVDQFELEWHLSTEGAQSSVA